MKKNKSSITFFTLILSLLSFYFVNRFFLVYESLGGSFLEKLNIALSQFLSDIQKAPFVLSTSQTSLIAGGIAVIAVWLVYLYKMFGGKNYMPGIEHGSAEWGI